MVNMLASQLFNVILWQISCHRIKNCQLGLSLLKVVKHIFSITVWILLGLYLMIMLALQLPSVQTYIGERAASYLSGKLGTSVTIGSAEVGLFNRLTLINVTLLDQQGQELLKAARVSARIDWMPLTQGRISISTAQLFGTHVKLYRKDAESTPNYQFVIDSLALKDTTETTPLDLRINSLIIRHSSVSYDSYDQPATPDVFNPNHLKVSNLSMHVSLKVLKEDSLNVNIKRLSFKEQSGLQVDRLSMKLESGRQQSRLSEFLLRMPGSNVQLGDINASYYFRDNHFVTPSLQHSGSIISSTVTPSDFASFLPALKNFKSPLSVSTHFHGQGDEVRIPSLVVRSETGDITISLEGWVKELTKQPTWYADIHDLALSANTVAFISENLKGEKIDVPDILNRLGSIHLTGVSSGKGVEELQTRSQLTTDAGKADIHFNINKQHNFEGTFNAQDINLGKLLANNQLGLMSTNIDLKGTLPAKGQPEVTAKGTIQQFVYNNYTYKNIEIDGGYHQGNVDGHVVIDDPNISVIAEGSISREDKTYDIALTTSILTLSPQALNLTDRWGDANFVTDIEANFKAKDLNDAVGMLIINNFSLLSVSGSYELDRLTIESGYNKNDIHYISMNSDFGEAKIIGDFDYNTIVQSFTNIIADKLPTLPGLPSVVPDTRNNFMWYAHITKSDWLQRVAKVPLTLDQPLSLEGQVNDAMRQVTLDFDAPQLTYDQTGYRHIHVSVTSPGDSLLYEVNATRLSADDEEQQLDIHIEGHAFDNLLTAYLDWDNHAKERMSGNLNVTASFDASIDGQQIVYGTIHPSTLNISNKIWNVEPAYVVYSNKHVDITQFAIRHEQQYLTINGTASELPEDTLTIGLQDIDVDYLLALVDFDAVDFNGRITGNGSLRGIFGNLEADAKLTVNQFEFQHGRMGTLTANVDWNKEQEQIDIHAIADDGPEAKTYVDGYVTPKRDSINLIIRADGTYLDFAKSFTESFISRIDGHATGSVNLIGPLSAINLTGEIILNGHAHVKTLGCTYEMRNDTLRCIPNEMEFISCPIYDMYGRRGIMTGGIHHKDLTNLTYDIYVDADNLLAYNFHEFGDDTFYGTVFATGEVAIHGRENELRIEGDLTPQRNTVFVYNAASPDAIANQEFITWGSKISNEENTRQKTDNSPDFRSDVHIDLRLNATTDAAVRLLMDARTNDYITLHGTGVLNTSYYNKGGFQMFGTYRVNDGTYDISIQDIIRKNFTFNEGGTAVFSGDPYDATLNMQAQYTVNGVSLSDLNVGKSFSNTVRVNCLMNITGQPRAPIVDFDLDIPNVNTDEKQMVRSVLNSQEELNQQVVYLLAVGRFYPQQVNNATEDATERSQTSLAMQSLLSGTLSGQINSMLNSFINSNNWNFGANISTGDEGWNNAEYEGIVNGRLLNNRLLINGQFGYRDNATTTTPSFIGDFDIRYLLFPNGNLALKVYNQTNDRYFTRSSLNTQGIGIIMKKDFNGLGDFFSNKKSKKKQKKDSEKR